MKFTIFLLFLFFQANLGKHIQKLKHFKKLPKFDFNFEKNRIKLAQLMAPKPKKIKRVMPQIQMDKNGYYKVDEYRKFLQQAYKKDRKNDVIPFKTAHIYKEHNLYYPSQQAIKRIKKKTAQKKYERKKKFERANAWRAFKKLGLRKSFLRHIPRQRVLKLLKNKQKQQKKKMDNILKKFQDLFGNQNIKKKQQRRLNEQKLEQPETKKQENIDAKNNQKEQKPVNQQKQAEEQKKKELKKKDIRQTQYLQRKALIDELRNQYHSIKRMEKQYKHIKLKQEAVKKHEFKARKLLQVIKQLKQEEKIKQMYILSNFNYKDPDYDFDFLNGQKSVLQYKKIENLDYKFKTSLDNFSKYYYLFSQCLQITNQNFDWTQIDSNVHTQKCRSRFASLIMILRNVFLYTENRILKLLPKQIEIENYQINKKLFFYGMVRQKYFSSEKSIDTLAQSIEEIQSLSIEFLNQKEFIQQFLKIAKISNNFYDLTMFAHHLESKNLVKFLRYINNECVFYIEIQQLINSFIAMDQGQIFLNEFQNKLQEETQNRKLNNKEMKQKNMFQNDQSLQKITKFLKKSTKNYNQLIQNEQNIFNNYKSKKNKRKLKLINTIKNILKQKDFSLQQNEVQNRILKKLFNQSQINKKQKININQKTKSITDQNQQKIQKNNQQKDDSQLITNNQSNQKKMEQKELQKTEILNNNKETENNNVLPKTI